jgi:hypothetical protein
MMPASRRAPTAAQLAERKRKIMRTELSTGIGCAIIGAAFLAGSHTMREMSIFLFGWAAACAFHLTQTVIVDRVGRRRKPRRGDPDAED